MTYTLVYMLIWKLPRKSGSVKLRQGDLPCLGWERLIKYDSLSTSHSTNADWRTRSCIVIQGLADAIIYRLNGSTWKMWRRVFSRNNSDEQVKGIENLMALAVKLLVKLERAFGIWIGILLFRTFRKVRTLLSEGLEVINCFIKIM